MTSESEGITRALIGADVGGTHTDVVAIVDGRRARGKALTTYDDFSRGVLDAVAVAAEGHELTREQLLAQTGLFLNATTVVTNAVTTLRGGKVGVLVTAGFKDTFHIGGGPRLSNVDDHVQVNMPALVARAAIAEIHERIDWEGRVIAQLDPAEVLESVQRLVVEQQVDSLAVCFVGSYVNPEHELEARAIVAEAYPHVFVTASHAVSPVVGETRRWTTAVLNSFVEQSASLYLESLDRALRAAGLSRPPVFLQGLGGAISFERAKEFPLALLGAGPAGGAIGARALADAMGRSNVLLGDMGGTSFDTGIIVDGRVRLARNVDLGLFQTGVSVVDVASVGAGGGSIASIGDRGVPRVGPESASSTPGPASYGRGGTEPTVTDAMVVLGFIDPDRYLGGRFTLDPSLAADSLEGLASRFGWTTVEAAAVVHDLVVVNMANAVHEVSVAKGHDPRECVFLAYGGTLPMFAMQIAERLGITEVVIPQNSSAFCALGLLAADFIVRNERMVTCGLQNADTLPLVNATAAELVTAGAAMMRTEGFTEHDVDVVRTGEVRFTGQAHELTVPLPDRNLVEADVAILSSDFRQTYETTYGKGTAWKDTPAELVSYTVTTIGRREPLSWKATKNAAPADPIEILIGTRNVFLPSLREYVEVPIYDDRLFTSGTSLAGPAIIDAQDTTLYVPPETDVRRDEYMNCVLVRSGEAA
jgi:N-methylhydantoinase A